MLNNEVRKTGMDDLFTRFFFALYQFHKLHMGDLVPDITKLEGMTMAAIKHCSGEKEELTVSELTAKLKAKGPAVSLIPSPPYYPWYRRISFSAYASTVSKRVLPQAFV